MINITKNGKVQIAGDNYDILEEIGVAMISFLETAYKIDKDLGDEMTAELLQMVARALAAVEERCDVDVAIPDVEEVEAKERRHTRRKKGDR